MSRKIKDDSKKTIPKIEDNRDNKKTSNQITISNYKDLDPLSDKDKIDKLSKEKLDALHNPYYSIDLNTSKVKQNEQVSFLLNINRPKQDLSDDNNEILNIVHQDYLKQMHNFNDELDTYLDKTYTTFKELDDDIYSFISMYDTYYYNVFNLRVKNYLDIKIKLDFIN